jgi:hypothetical protein
LGQLEQSLIGILGQTAGSTGKLWVNRINFEFKERARHAGNDSVPRQWLQVIPFVKNKDVMEPEGPVIVDRVAQVAEGRLKYASAKLPICDSLSTVFERGP